MIKKPELEVKSNECEDIKNSLDAIRKLWSLADAFLKK